ncbi:cell division protein ZapE [Marinicella litoralis]|uniref:Cell division protein ZapE n=1 Tax=Marinicella litoralis TaxID=644220 RepID=A0A4R6XSW0_9GAMM|nr:cell division protein ZapE [Marinicella litoralis]TDR19438.1 cell division protein ZapE [Marinicella litoralis]
MSGPKYNYLSEIEAGVIWRDELQAHVVAEFERLYQGLTGPRSNRWLFAKTPPTQQGIYIYGSVGRGKTHLMDLFYDSLPDQVGKQRQHYHEFMLWLHEQLRSQTDTKDPLKQICKKLAKDVQVLCLDEFLVNDIANAMLLAVMLEAFSQYGIALVTTSNVKPDNLYKGGLQRAKFLPAIEWIKQNMKVMHLDGSHDYRQQDSELADQQHENWYYPINESSLFHINDCFKLLTKADNQSTADWQINDRSLSVVKYSPKTLWCQFDALCKQARNAADYIEIAKKIDTLIISDIPQMSADNDNEARRFITLIDVMYENDVKIIAQAACHYKIIYHGTKMAFEFERSSSRLAELLLQ